MASLDKTGVTRPGWLTLGVLVATTTLLVGQERWQELAPYAQEREALPPTPTGDGHLQFLASGVAAHIRFPVPAAGVAGYWVRLANAVAYSGQGTSYRLIVRCDREDGPLVYEGPVVANGDRWNVSNQSPIDITQAITETQRAAGAIDLFVTAETQGDGWTLYRNSPERPITASVVELTAELRLQMNQEKQVAEAGGCLLPLPRTFALADGAPLVLTDGTTVYAAAECEDTVVELTEILRQRVGITLRRAPAAEAVIRLELGYDDGPESYHLDAGKDGATVTAADPAGLFYGAIALAQLARMREGRVEVPACEIRDKPAFRDRIIQYDIARGQTVNVPYVKRLIREFARCRINGLLFYMEDDFRFRAYPFLGREGTFTHEKARELVQYARRYHVRLMPQFESLGHAAAVLRHEELASLREAGGGVFCTMEEGTWEFLGTVFSELVEAFPDSPFIHIGGDEFEHGFGHCDRCREVVSREGVGGLYTRHMNRLNELVKARGKTMTFWPSHSGPTPELSEMSIQYAPAMQKDCIPTEWIYHGPALYPTIQIYQDLGFADVLCCPAVVSYSRVWPDYAMTFRGIQGFYRAGAARGCGGAYCTTWEFMHGALLENSMFGLIFAAECSWNPSGASRRSFNRRFADWWWGLTDPEDPDRVETLFQGLISETIGESLFDSHATQNALWCAPRAFVLDICSKQPGLARQLQSFESTMAGYASLARSLQQRAQSNEETLDAAQLGFGLLHFAGMKATRLTRAADAFAGARLAANDRDKAAALTEAALALGEVAEEAVRLAQWVERYVELRGAYAGDAQHLRDQATELEAMAAEVQHLQTEPITALPDGRGIGIARLSTTKVGTWDPASVSETGTTLRYDVSPSIKGPGTYTFEFEYTRGEHGLRIHEASLQADGTILATDRHPGWAGSGSTGTLFTMTLADLKPDAPLSLVAEVASSGGRESYGTVWLFTAPPPD